jgi:hypothetical protein
MQLFYSVGALLVVTVKSPKKLGMMSTLRYPIDYERQSYFVEPFQITKCLKIMAQLPVWNAFADPTQTSMSD